MATAAQLIRLLQRLSQKVYTNQLTPVRKHRYNKAVNVFCETCRSRPASLVHMLQECLRSHGSRINRHDSIEKYSSANIEDSVKNLTGAHTVSFGAFALTWNGIVSARSARLALELGLGRNFVKNSSLTALFGSLKCYRQYNKTTYGTTPLDYEFFDAE